MGAILERPHGLNAPLCGHGARRTEVFVCMPGDERFAFCARRTASRRRSPGDGAAVDVLPWRMDICRIWTRERVADLGLRVYQLKIPAAVYCVASNGIGYPYLYGWARVWRPSQVDRGTEPFATFYRAWQSSFSPQTSQRCLPLHLCTSPHFLVCTKSEKGKRKIK